MNNIAVFGAVIGLFFIAVLTFWYFYFRQLLKRLKYSMKQSIYDIMIDTNKYSELSYNKKIYNISKSSFSINHEMLDNYIINNDDLIIKYISSRSYPKSIVTSESNIEHSEDKYKEKMRYISSVTSDIAHALKSPISGIKVNLKFLKQEAGQDINSRIQALDTLISLLEDTIEGYGTLSRKNDNEENLDIGELLETRLKLLSMASNKKININCSIQKNLNISLKIFRKLEIAIMCIAENAFDAVSDNGIVTLKMTRNGDNIEINIYNNGPRINEEEGRIFNEGFSTKGSTGIGLAVSKEIIEKRLDGKIIYRNVENGIEFIINIRSELN
jgi:signal transduction histidine kinase